MKKKRIMRACSIGLFVILLVVGTVFAIQEFAKKQSIKTDNEKKEEDTEVKGNNIRFLGKEKISEVAKEAHYDLNGVYDIDNDIVCVRGENETEYYSLNNGELEKLDFPYTEVRDVIKIDDTEYSLQFNYGMLNGRFYWKDTANYSESDMVASIIGQHKGDFVWLQMGMQNTAYCYILYNIKTGEVIDIIKDILGDITPIELFERSPNEKYAAVMTEDNVYLINLEENQGKSLQEEAGLGGRVYCEFINDTLLQVSQMKEEAEGQMEAGKPYEVNEYSYSIETGEMKSFYVFKKGSSIALGHGFYIEAGNKNYILITPSGERLCIEEIKPNYDINFKLSSDCKKIVAVTSITGGNGEKNEIKPNEVSVIDIEKREMKIYQVENVEEDFVTQLIWIRDCIVIREEDEAGIYVYYFK